jgi:PLP dependent protein
MQTIADNIQSLRAQLPPHVVLVAVSKTKPDAAIADAYAAGQRDFGENYVQELLDKQQRLPNDIRWHFIGHLQTNKVKQVVPFVHLIHAVDSERLLLEIDKQAAKCNRVVDLLLQVHVAQEETKFGWSAEELLQQMASLRSHSHVRIRGLMAMASNTDDSVQIENEFGETQRLFATLQAEMFSSESSFDILSMGMSGDWPLAVSKGSTMIRIGSTIFGNRIYPSASSATSHSNT